VRRRKRKGWSFRRTTAQGRLRVDNMPIIYALVARGTCVLAEYTGTNGNFTTVTRRILEKIPPQDAKMSYVYDRHIFHYIVDDGITYLCMADEEFGRRIPFAFLEDIKNRFRATYGDRGRTAIAYGMNTDFSRVLQNQMDYYSNNPGADKINRVRGEIDEVKSVMVHNIEKVLERGERIELLVDKTENLNQSAFKFKKSSTQLKRAMWWKNVKIMIILILVILAIVYFVAAMACGGLTFKRCVNKAKEIVNNPTTTTTTTTTTTGAATTGDAGTTGGTDAPTIAPTDKPTAGPTDNPGTTHAATVTGAASTATASELSLADAVNAAARVSRGLLSHMARRAIINR
jgi:vesicle-associated membrane protein 7